MNLIIKENVSLSPYREVVIAVPFPYLILAKEKLKNTDGYNVAAQNCYDAILSLLGCSWGLHPRQFHFRFGIALIAARKPTSWQVASRASKP